MANMATASGVYQQMVVPAPYHFHQPQCQLVPTIPHSSPSEPKKEPKKRKKVVDKTVADKKKSRVSNQTSNSYMNVLRPDAEGDKSSKIESCPVCNKRKCFKHLDPKSRAQISKKTPEDVVLQMKKHMLKLLSNDDYAAFCKVDQKVNQVDIDIVKMHHLYLEEHEPQVAEALSSSPEKEPKPKVKRWLYRKIFLDEFKTFDYGVCKMHLGELKRNIDDVILQKKKKTQKPKPSSTPPNQAMPQDYSISNHSLPNGTPPEMTRPGIPPPVVGPTHNAIPPAPAGYQPNLMSIGVDTSTAPVSCMAMAGATPPTLHNSLATYMTQQVPTNLLFGLGQQQTPPAQQQPLNLQTSHQTSMQPPPGNHQPPGGAQQQQQQQQQHQHPPGAPPIPLNLHNPYYVSFSPMLPLHMTAPQHNHQQQFQQNIMQPQGTQGGFNQHVMYQ